MQAKINYYLAGFIVSVIATLVIAFRLHSYIAGGGGTIGKCVAVMTGNVNAKIVRGQQMITQSGAFAKYQLCDGTILYLDENTQVELSSYPHAHEPTTLKLIQGRLLVDGLAHMQTRNVDTEVSGAGCEVVHYSWLDQADVTPFAEQACEVDGVKRPTLGSTTRYDTFDGHEISRQMFTPELSAAKNFYAWTGLELKNLR